MADASQAIVVPLPFGTTAFDAVSADPAYGAVNGSTNVSGPGTQVTVSFQLVEFLITFVEQGLPNGSVWGILVGVSGSEHVRRPPGPTHRSCSTTAAIRTRYRGRARSRPSRRRGPWL